MDVFNLQASIGIDTKAYTNGVKNAISIGQKLKESVEKQAQSVTKEQVALDALGNKLEVAKSATSEARGAVSKLTDAFNKAVKETGAESDEARELAASLDKAEKELADCERQEKELSEQMDELKGNTKKAGEQAEESASKFGKFNDGLKAVASTAGKVVSAVAKISAVAVGAAATGLAALTKQALDASASYEQLKGGVETLFGAGGMSIEEYAKSVGKSVEKVEAHYNKLMAAQDKVIQNSYDAYKTAGMSSNEYMETVTSFSASLLQSVAGDTTIAADIADMAIRDMSDNANKMGTSMESIQNAYQGFAKQNYTMLDNLKLGYGGTKEEMERLLSDAEKLSGQKYNISSLKDVYEAIHLVQQEMGITGTTAKEASGTIEGSVGSMKAAWENLLTAFGSTDMPIDTFAQNLVASISGAAGNVVPRIGEIIKSIGMTFPGLVSDLFTNLKDTIMENDLGTTVLDGIDSLVTNGASVLQEILSGILEGSTLTDLISRASGTVGTIVESILGILGSVDIGTVTNILNDLVNKIIGGISELISSDGVDDLLGAVIKAVLSIAENLASNVQPLATAVLKLLTSIMTVVLNNLDDIIDTASAIIQALLDAIVSDGGILDGVITLVSAIADGIVENSDAIMLAIENIITAIWEKITEPETLSKIIEAGVTIVTKMLEGLMSAAGSVLGFVVSMLERAVELIFTRDYKEIGISIIEAIRDGLFASEPVKEFIEKWISDFEEFGGNLYDKVQELKQNIQDKFNELVTNAVNWGKDMIQNFIDGIASKWSALTDKVNSAAQLVKDFIGFSEPKEGPLSNFHTYAPDMIDLFTSGIEDNAYKIEDAFDKSLDFGTVSASGSIQSGGTSSGAVNGTFTAELLNVLHEILNAVKEGKTISVSAIDSALGQLQSFDERTEFA